MKSHSTFTQVHLVDYAPQGDVFRTEILPEIVALLNPAKMAIKIMPAAGTVDDLTADLPIEPGGWQVVFYNRAEQAVENALFAGTLPREALAAWKQEMTALLGFHRQHRRSVLLVDRTAVSHTPQLFARGLSTYLDIPLPEPADAQALPRATTSVEAVIAAQTVVQSLHAKRLNGELDASSLPMAVAGMDALCDVDMAFQSYRETPSLDAALTEDLETKNDLLLLQLGTTQEELEDYFKRWGVQKQQTSDLEGRIQVLQKNGAQANAALLAAQDDLKQLREQHKALAQNATAENDLLLMQLSNVQEELETYFLEAKQLKAACIQYEEQLATLGGQSSAAVQDAKGLSDRLQDVERKLQEARNTLNHTEGKMQEVAGHLHTTEDSLKEREQNLEQAQHNVAQLETQLHQREDELHHFLQSTSWRVTGPLRRIKDRLSGSRDQEH